MEGWKYFFTLFCCCRGCCYFFIHHFLPWRRVIGFHKMSIFEKFNWHYCFKDAYKQATNLHVAFFWYSHVLVLCVIKQMFRSSPFDWKSALSYLKAKDVEKFLQLLKDINLHSPQPFGAVHMHPPPDNIMLYKTYKAIACKLVLITFVLCHVCHI